MVSEVVQVEGHIIDSLILAKVLDVIVEAGADYRIVDVDVGRSSVGPSRARIEVDTPDDESLTRLLEELQVCVVNRLDAADAPFVLTDLDGALRPASTQRPTCRPPFASSVSGWRSRTPRWTAVW
jgi:hypothetical protein